MATTERRAARRRSRSGERWTTANTIASCSIAVAFMALGLSALQAWQTIRAQRLSVLPYVVFQASYGADGAQFTMDNRGVGPASLRWFEAWVDGRPQGSWPELMDAAGLPRSTPFHQSIPARGVMMQPSPLTTSIRILSVETPGGREALLAAARRITLRACYCSLYGDCWIASSDRPEPKPMEACDPAPRTEFSWAR